MKTLLVVAALGFIATRPVKEPPEETHVRFDGDAIDGDIVRPEGDLVLARPELELPSVVRAPESFESSARRERARAAAELGGEVNGD